MTKKEVQDAFEQAEEAKKELPSGAGINDFYAHLPSHKYIYTPTRELWPAGSINATIPPVTVLKSGVPVPDETTKKPKTIPAATWLDQNQSVVQMTWFPGEPMIIKDHLLIEGGWMKRKGVDCFNLYMPPAITPGDAIKAGPWLDHVHYVFPDEADEIIFASASRNSPEGKGPGVRRRLEISRPCRQDKSPPGLGAGNTPGPLVNQGI